jgi:N-acetylneuraminic acid mutarotase
MDTVGYALAQQITSYRWKSLAPVPNAEAFNVAEVVGEKAYVIGMDYTQVYDFATNTWTQEPPMPAARKRTRFASCVVGTHIYIIGGVTTTSGSQRPASRLVDIYDTVAKTWSTGPDIPDINSGHGLVDAKCAHVNGKIYLMGGRAGLSFGGTLSDTINRTYELDIQTGVWTRKRDMPIEVSEMGVAVYNDRIYTFGGLREVGTADPTFRAEILQYNPSADSWTTVKSLQVAKSACAAVLVEDTIYIIGGKENVLSESYKPSNNTSTFIQSPTISLSYFGAVSYGGAVYVFDAKAANRTLAFYPAGDAKDALLAWLATR